MSKSLGTIVDPLEAADRLGADPLRLYLVKEIPYGGDGDFSWERFEERYNVDLANNLGQPREPRHGDGGEVPRAGGCRRRRSPSGRLPRDRRPRRWPPIATAMDRFALHEARGGRLRADRRDQRVHRRRPRRGRWRRIRRQADALTGVLFDAAEARARRGRPAVAGHAGLGRGDSAPRRRRSRRRPTLRLTRCRVANASGANARERASSVAATRDDQPAP